MSGIDTRAAVADGAVIGADVKIGPFAVIGDKVVIGDGTEIGPHAVIEGLVSMGKKNKIGPFASIGTEPQHVNYKGEETRVEIGDGNRIREYSTINRGTLEGGGVTRIGNDCFIMIGCHVAHDCKVGDRVIMANLSTLAGHVEVEDDAVLGGFTAVHQHCRVGRAVMIGAGAKLSKDAPPFALVGGEPIKFAGLNRVGLRRIGMDEESRKKLRRAYRLIFKKGLSLEEGLAQAEGEFSSVPEVGHVIEFIRGSSRGVYRD